MRVDYTLPALQPWAPAETPEITAQEGSSFQDLVRGGAAELPPTVDALLRLDVRPFTGTYVGPPPRPPVLGHDAESQRRQWYGMLHRHSGGAGMGTRSHGGRAQSVQNMVEMLLDMQDMEDSIVSQAVALSRG
jgi:hypothetical protein